MALKTVRLLLWLPLIAFVAIVALVAGGLIHPHETVVRSRLIGQPLPGFTLPRAEGGAPLTPAALADGRPHLLNLFASWCVPCAAEAPQLRRLRAAGVPIIGVAIRDRPQDLAAFLRETGNPYAMVARDDAAALQVALGSSGVPESFVIDGRGVIRYQHIGAIGPDQIALILEQLRAAR
ncbi:redoxin family protein [Sphingomonas morindae]|uniref:Redoxin family protein n=1 Tax=Sphingomonas morindae TaxID=1541170 RepID=A0ABY4X794_9SPHN|nr:redoxin family protein [Sphingomonas morindae]USI72485.1 redoxin family protein [Sphingomonas morindae]